MRIYYSILTTIDLSGLVYWPEFRGFDGDKMRWTAELNETELSALKELDPELDAVDVYGGLHDILK